jgi:hypothetical protein
VSQSWGHAVRPMTETEIAFARREHERPSWFQQSEEEFAAAAKGWNAEDRRCKAGRCKEDSEFVVAYYYITGRAMRTSSAKKNVCLDHAMKFAAANGLAMELAS